MLPGAGEPMALIGAGSSNVGLTAAGFRTGSKTALANWLVEGTLSIWEAGGMLDGWPTA